MTLKQAFKRYLKNKGLYGPLINHINAEYHMKNFGKLSECDLYYYLCYYLRSNGFQNSWEYTRKRISFEEFSRQAFKHNFGIPQQGDLITVKTPDGKYSFDYEVVNYGPPRFGCVNALTPKQKRDEGKIIYPSYEHTIIRLDRIDKVNGIPVNYKDGWELRDQRVYNVLQNNN